MWASATALPASLRHRTDGLPSIPNGRIGLVKPVGTKVNGPMPLNRRTDDGRTTDEREVTLTGA